MSNIIKVAIPLSRFEETSHPIRNAFNEAMQDLCKQFPEILVPWAAQQQKEETGSWIVPERPYPWEKPAGLYKSTLHVFDIGFRDSDGIKVDNPIAVEAYAGCQAMADENLMLSLVSPKRTLRQLQKIDLRWEFPENPCIVASSTRGGFQQIEFSLT